MINLHSLWVLWACLTVLTFGSALADPSAVYDDDSGFVVLTGIDQTDRESLLAEPSRVSLKLSGQQYEYGMLLTLSEDESGLVVRPTYRLLHGRDYDLMIRLLNKHPIKKTFSTRAKQVEPPHVLSVLPSGLKIPSNTLRFYIAFSQPMARGQARSHISLEDEMGRKIANPFLNLATELWDREQERITLTIDPGRQKRGVGPNQIAGPALLPGRSYALVVSASFQSADGVAMGSEQRFTFRVTEPLRTGFSPGDWDIQLPAAGSVDPLVVVFDRMMDVGTAVRLLNVADHTKRSVSGAATTDGQVWRFAPTNAWSSGQYILLADPSLEDIAGNRRNSPFDAPAGATREAIPATELLFSVGL